MRKVPKATGFFEGDKFRGGRWSLFDRLGGHDFQFQESPPSGCLDRKIVENSSVNQDSGHREASDFWCAVPVRENKTRIASRRRTDAPSPLSQAKGPTNNQANCQRASPH
jgi:hypothetical protein